MSKFKVGDRVRVRKWWNAHHRPELGIVVGELNDDDRHAVEFPGWMCGHDADIEDGSKSRWFVSVDEMEFVFSHPIDDLATSSSAAKFQVVYIEDEDETFDTQEAAEAHAYELAQGDPGAQFAVFKRLAIARPEVKIERFA